MSLQQNPICFLLDVKAILICGGLIEDQFSYEISSNECFILDKYSSKLFVTMTEKRAFAASLITNENSLWVTGGGGEDYLLSSTEYITKNGDTVRGPELPLALAGHTVVGINSTLSMLIGGTSDGQNAIDLTYYYDHFNQAWSNGPKLNIGRGFGHGTGTVTDLITKEKLVVVTCGSTDDEYILQSTEILIDGIWVLGNENSKTFV